MKKIFLSLIVSSIVLNAGWFDDNEKAKELEQRILLLENEVLLNKSKIGDNAKAIKYVIEDHKVISEKMKDFEEKNKDFLNQFELVKQDNEKTKASVVNINKSLELYKTQFDIKINNVNKSLELYKNQFLIREKEDGDTNNINNPNGYNNRLNNIVDNEYTEENDKKSVKNEKTLNKQKNKDKIVNKNVLTNNKQITNKKEDGLVELDDNFDLENSKGLSRKKENNNFFSNKIKTLKIKSNSIVRKSPKHLSGNVVLVTRDEIEVIKLAGSTNSFKETNVGWVHNSRIK
jgi:hypothetical protein